MTQPPPASPGVTELFDSNTALEVLAAALRNLPGGSAALDVEIATAQSAAKPADAGAGSSTPAAPTPNLAVPGV